MNGDSHSTGGGDTHKGLSYYLITVVLVAFILKTVKVIFLPLAYTLLIFILVEPFQDWLDRLFKGKLRAVNVLLSLLLILLVISLFIGAIWLSASVMAEKLPGYVDAMSSYWERITSWVQQHNISMMDSGGKVQGIGRSIFTALNIILSSLTSLISVLVLILFLVLLLLVERQQWKSKLAEAFSGAKGQHIVKIMETIAHKVRLFLPIRTFSGLAQGILVAAWLVVLGIDFAIVWGILSFLFNYIPYIGAFLVAIPASLIAVIQFGWQRSLLVLAGILVANQTIGNYLEPRFEGKVLTISPFLLLLFLVFWSCMRGVAGTLLAVPLAIAVTVTAETIPSLHAAGILMAHKKK